MKLKPIFPNWKIVSIQIQRGVREPLNNSKRKRKEKEKESKLLLAAFGAS